MALPLVGYGGSGNFASIQGLIRDFSPEKFSLQTNLDCPLLASGALVREKRVKGDVIVEIDVGSTPSTTFGSDGSARPVGQMTIPQKARFVPTLITSTMQIGLQAAIVELADEEMIDLVDAKLEAASDDVNRQIARGLYGSTINPQGVATWSGTAANSTVTIPFLDISMFRENAGYNFVDTSAALSYTVRCLVVTPGAVGANSGDVAGTVTFINDVINPVTGAVTVLGATAVDTTDILGLRGAFLGFGASATPPAGVRLNNFDDISGTGALLSFGGVLPADVPGWTGTSRNLAANYSQEAALRFGKFLHQRSGKHFTHVIMGEQLAAQHAIMSGGHGAGVGSATAVPTANRPMPLTSSMDKYAGVQGSGLTLGARPVIEDPNCPQTLAIFHNQKHAKLAVWREPSPEMQGNESLFVDQQSLGYKAFFTGSLQLYTSQRSAIGVLSGITGM